MGKTKKDEKAMEMETNSYTVDLENANQSVWILKVPQDLVDIWRKETSKGDRMESLYVGDFVECSQVKEGCETEKKRYFISDEELMGKANVKESPIPHVYTFEKASRKPEIDVDSQMESCDESSNKLSNQRHFVLGEASGIQTDTTAPRHSMFGKVKHKYNLNALGLDQASTLSKKGIEIERKVDRKIKIIKESDIPKEEVESMANIEVSKQGGRRASLSCPAVDKTVLEAFEDNYRISQQDLLRLTKLPKGALLKSLEKLANKSIGSKNRIIWQLKREYLEGRETKKPNV